MTHALPNTLTRRHVLAGSALIPASMAIGPKARAAEPAPASDAFTYEVTRTDDEWKARLNDLEYFVMRQGGTEPQQSSLLAFERREGSYRCKGCDLTAFDSNWKVPHFDIGWVFFQQARPDTILTGIDTNFGAMGEDGETVEPSATIECHCRRCGSHMGHILNVRGEVLHCLNGASLVFSPV